MNDGPTYPVLALGRDGSIVPYENAVELTSCNAIGYWRNRYYEDLRVYDSAARAWRADAATLTEPAGAFAQVLVRAANGRLRVTVTWRREPDRDGMENARMETEAWLYRDRDFWESAAELGEWVRGVRESATMKRLISTFQ
jgi:hypothetical protein